METPTFYTMLPAAVRYDKNLKPNEKLLFAEISALTNVTGYCYASNAYFQNLFDASTRTVQGWLKQLQDCGYISINGDKLEDMSEKKQVRTMQVMVVFFIVLSVVIAMDPPTFIAQLMGISWGALAGAFLAPFMYGLYWKGVTRAAVWASFAAGVGITVLNLFFHFIASPINAGAVAMVAGLIVVPVVSVLTPKLKKDRVDEIFACYDEKVTITKKRSLEQN